MDIDKIRPYSKNAKKHPDKQLKQIANSLKEFGWQQPIVVDKDGVIIVGHGRYEAYKKYPDGISEPDIKLADLTEEQAKAYRLADNKLNESEWDIGLAIEELKGLSDDMFDFTGFDKEFVDGIENAEQINELAREREIDLGQYQVLTVEAPEAPRLKARVSFYTRDIEEFNKIKDFFECRGGSLNIDKLNEIMR
jgi:hypothetical protein